MNPEEFEDKLARQSLRAVPSDWRADILRAAEVAQTGSKPMRSQRGNRFDWLQAVGRELIFSFWPNAKGWAGLAAVWVLIAVLNFSMRDANDTNVSVAATSPAVSPAVMTADLKLSQRFLAELSGPADTQPDADRPKNFPLKPHSQHVGFQAV